MEETPSLLDDGSVYTILVLLRQFLYAFVKLGDKQHGTLATLSKQSAEVMQATVSYLAHIHVYNTERAQTMTEKYMATSKCIHITSCN